MGEVRWSVRLLAAMAALGLVAAGCGRGSEQESGPDRTSATTAGDRSGGDASFGTLRDVCGPGNPSGSPAQGVTPTEIRIATFSDAGASFRPGLNQEMFDAAEVFAAWCNDLGGIGGRRIVVHQRDAALFNVKPEMAKACAEDFMMVGGGAVFDADGVRDRLSCLLPDIAGFVVNPEARGADLVVQPVPNALETISIGDLIWLKERFPRSLARVAVLGGDLPATKLVADQNREAAESVGAKIVYDDRYPAAGAASWVPYAQAIKSAGAKGLIWVGEPENLSKFLRALANAGYELDWVRADPNHYDRKLIDLDPEVARNVFIRSVYFPFEQADRNPATAKYLELFERYKPGGKARAYLGLQAMSAWLLFAQAAKACGNDLTRRCVYEQAAAVDDWTGGGLHARQNPKAGEASECFMIIEATPRGFRTPDVRPNEGIFRCEPAAVYRLRGDYPKGVKLADVGRSLDDLR